MLTLSPRYYIFDGLGGSVNVCVPREFELKEPSAPSTQILLVLLFVPALLIMVELAPVAAVDEWVIQVSRLCAALPDGGGE